MYNIHLYIMMYVGLHIIICYACTIMNRNAVAGALYKHVKSLYTLGPNNIAGFYTVFFWDSLECDGGISTWYNCTITKRITGVYLFYIVSLYFNFMQFTLLHSYQIFFWWGGGGINKSGEISWHSPPLTLKPWIRHMLLWTQFHKYRWGSFIWPAHLAPRVLYFWVLCSLLPARLITGLYWMVAVLSSVDTPLAVKLRFLLTDVDMPNWRY